MKILYILAVLMIIGIFLIVVCSFKVLTDLSGPRRTRIPFRTPPKQKPVVKPAMQPYVIGTYLGLTFFAVGAVGSIFAVYQVLKREL